MTCRPSRSCGTGTGAAPVTSEESRGVSASAGEHRSVDARKVRKSRTTDAADPTDSVAAGGDLAADEHFGRSCSATD
jgi:hypothetical protein